MRILAFPNGTGSTAWRLTDPFKYLNKIDGFECKISPNVILHDETQEYDVYVIQSVTHKEGLAFLYGLQQEEGKKIVCEVDDFIKVSPDNPHKAEHEMLQAEEVTKVMLRVADMVTTTTPYLAEKLREFNKNVVVLPNYMDLDGRWGGDVRKNTSDEIRIGWAGSITHFEDIKLIEKPLKRILSEYPKVKLILMGDMRFRDMFEGYNVDVKLGVPIDVYPAILRSAQLDIGLAPLVDNEFTRCKSWIKPMEYALCKVPCIASNVEPYKKSLAVTRVDNVDDWYYELKDFVEDEYLRRKSGETAHKQLYEKYNLKDHIGEWVEAYNSLYYNKEKSNK